MLELDRSTYSPEKRAKVGTYNLHFIFSYIGVKSYRVLKRSIGQIRFSIGGERVTCHGSKLANSLGKVIRSCTFETAAKIRVLFYFELGGITKHSHEVLMNTLQ